MDDQVSPLISPAFAETVTNLALAISVLVAIRFAYRYFMFRHIDKTGFNDPDLQAMHLQMRREESQNWITRTQLQLVYAIASAALAVGLWWYAYV